MENDLFEGLNNDSFLSWAISMGITAALYFILWPPLVLSYPEYVENKWLHTFWALSAALFGGYWSINTKGFVQGNVKHLQKMYEKTGIPLFGMQAKGMQSPYMYPFSRGMLLFFCLMGSTMLLQIIGIL